MSVIDDFGSMLARLPAAAVLALYQIVKGALSSDDPTRYIQRRAEADAADAAADAAIEKALGK